MLRLIYRAGGFAMLALAFAGAVLPVLPTVPFLLLAAFCFSRSNPELAERLYTHPRYGPAMRDWRDRRAIPRRAKIAAILAMATGTAITWAALGWPWVLGPAAALVLVGPWIWTRAQ